MSTTRPRGHAITRVCSEHCSSFVLHSHQHTALDYCRLVYIATTPYRMFRSFFEMPCMAKIKLITNPFNPFVGRPGLPRPALTWVETRTFPKDWDGLITCKFSECTRWDMICAVIKQVSG